MATTDYVSLRRLSKFYDDLKVWLSNHYATPEDIEEALAGFGFKIVPLGQGGVPDVNQPSTKVIYLTKEEPSAKTDPYTEWIYTVDDTTNPPTTSWECIGETSPDIAEMVGATSSTAGTSGVVPGPIAGQENSFLQGNGTWGDAIFSESIAQVFDPTIAYEEKSIVVYKGKVYKCDNDTTAGILPTNTDYWHTITVLPLNDYDAEAVQEVVATVDKMESDLDTKLNTTLLLGNLINYYDTVGDGVMLCQAFTVPINSKIRTITESPSLPTLLSVVAKQNYGARVILGLYEYSFATESEAENIKYLCDTGPITINQGKNEFPVRNISDEVGHELKSEKIYYAALFVIDREGLQLLGGPGCSTNQDMHPRLNIYKANLSTSLTTLSTTTISQSDSQHTNDFPRFLMMIRNGHYEEPIPPAAFTPIYTSHSVYQPGDSGARTIAQLMNGQTPASTPSNYAYFAFQKVVPGIDFELKSWTTYSPLNANPDSSWDIISKYLMKDNNYYNIINESEWTLTIEADQTYDGQRYKWTVTKNSGTFKLNQGDSYWFPVCGSWSSDGSTVAAIYDSNTPTKVNKDIIVSTQKWNVDSNYCVSSTALNAAYLKVTDGGGNEYVI